MQNKFQAKMIYSQNQFQSSPLFVNNGIISSNCSGNEQEFVFDNFYILPGFVDVHVHLREPGFSYKETIASGSAASANGGYTTVCSMPNLNPVPDSYENLKIQLDIIQKDAKINVIPYGSITKGEMGEELADMEAMAQYVAGFSDDGKGVQNDDMMQKAMIEAKRLGKMIVSHCEENSLLKGGYIHDGQYAKENNHKGICCASEWVTVERDLKLVEKTGCAYHVCHISCKETVELIRQAKAKGLDVTCETGPHYLVFNDMDIKEEGRFKMNPPIRGEEDRLALIEGIKDGTIDMIATDHAPHSAEEKSKGLAGSMMGVVGIETAFAVMYTNFVKTGEITFEKLIELLSLNARKRFNIKGGTNIGDSADFCVVDLDTEYEIDPENFVSKGKATPFAGKKVYGKIINTFVGGKQV